MAYASAPLLLAAALHHVRCVIQDTLAGLEHLVARLALLVHSLPFLVALIALRVPRIPLQI